MSSVTDERITPVTWGDGEGPFFNVWEGPRDPAVQAEIKAGLTKQNFVARQWKQVIGEGPQVTCECGLTLPLRFAFRCLYCGQFYCARCAGEHFGATRAQYYERKDRRQRIKEASDLWLWFGVGFLIGWLVMTAIRTIDSEGTCFLY